MPRYVLIMNKAEVNSDLFAESELRRIGSNPTVFWFSLPHNSGLSQHLLDVPPGSLPLEICGQSPPPSLPLPLLSSNIHWFFIYYSRTSSTISLPLVSNKLPTKSQHPDRVNNKSLFGCSTLHHRSVLLASPVSTLLSTVGFSTLMFCKR